MTSDCLKFYRGKMSIYYHNGHAFCLKYSGVRSGNALPFLVFKEKELSKEEEARILLQISQEIRREKPQEKNLENSLEETQQPEIETSDHLVEILQLSMDASWVKNRTLQFREKSTGIINEEFGMLKLEILRDDHLHLIYQK